MEDQVMDFHSDNTPSDRASIVIKIQIIKYAEGVEDQTKNC